MLPWNNSDPGYISNQNLERLNALRNPGESDDDLINRTLDFIEFKASQGDEEALKLVPHRIINFKAHE